MRGLSAELHEILEEIPTQEYLHDLHALQASLDAAEGKTTADSKTTRARSGVKKRAA